MRRVLTFGVLGLGLILGILWLTGALGSLSRELELLQRTSQNQLAEAIRALRAQAPGALAGFWTVCFGYGVLHAVGPGHGKAVIGGYGLARRVPVLRLAGLALVSSLAQAAVAVVLVYALVVLLGLTRSAVQGAADTYIAPLGYLMLGGLGLWLVWRGLSTLTSKVQHQNCLADDADHHHVRGPECNHQHGPTIEQVEDLGSWRDGVILVGAIALRPCTGALFLLVIAFQLGIAFAGIVGAFIMGLGTAVVTVASAFLAVWARDGALAGLGGTGLARAFPIVEVIVGALIALAAGNLLFAGF